MSYVCFASYNDGNATKSRKKTFMSFFHYCKFYNNQTRPDDRPRSLARDGDIINTSLMIDCFFTSSVCSSTTKNEQYSLILHCK